MAGVVNLKHRADLRAALAHGGEAGGVVRIDRRTRWGNPFAVGRDGTREAVIARHRRWLWRRIGRGEVGLEELARLHGKSLACWCHPLPCHGHTLARAAAWAAGALAAARPGRRPPALPSQEASPW